MAAGIVSHLSSVEYKKLTLSQAYFLLADFGSLEIRLPLNMAAFVIAAQKCGVEP